MDAKVDIAIIGECLVELSSNGTLADTSTLNKFFGGDTVTTAVAIARLGGNVTYLTQVGNDGFSEFILSSLQKENIDGIRISIESDEMGIYKSFNYEIFERRNSVVMAFDGNSPVSNLIQEAKNGKGKAKIYVNEDSPSLFDKAVSLEGYAIPFKTNQNIIDKIVEDNPDIMN